MLQKSQTCRSADLCNTISPGSRQRISPRWRCGSPTLRYLAAAGAGRRGIIDDDRVDITNLQRQVIHATAAVGSLKVESAANRIRELNPEIEVVEHNIRLDVNNALQ